MGHRVNLQDILERTLGSRNVYFQPPESIKMSYPCIVYRRSGDVSTHANNILYSNKIKYQITVIDKNPDGDTNIDWMWDEFSLHYGSIPYQSDPPTTILERIRQLPLCKFDRYYTVDNLNHDIFNIYY